jgi:hypothetical protein
MIKNRVLFDEGLEVVNGTFCIIKEFSPKHEQNHHLVQPHLQPNPPGMQEQWIVSRILRYNF